MGIVVMGIIIYIVIGKDQNEKFQIPMSKYQILDLKFGTHSLFGAWNLGFSELGFLNF
jgi:hypothetical protein